MATNNKKGESFYFVEGSKNMKGTKNREDTQHQLIIK